MRVARPKVWWLLGVGAEELDGVSHAGIRCCTGLPFPSRFKLTSRFERRATSRSFAWPSRVRRRDPRRTLHAGARLSCECELGLRSNRGATPLSAVLASGLRVLTLPVSTVPRAASRGAAEFEKQMRLSCGSLQHGSLGCLCCSADRSAGASPRRCRCARRRGSRGSLLVHMGGGGCKKWTCPKD